MTRKVIQRMILSVGTVLVLLASVVILETHYQFLAKCADMPWPIWICVVALVMVCAVFPLVVHKNTTRTQPVSQEIKQEAEQLFVGGGMTPRMKDAIMLDKASALQMDPQELFRAELN